MDQTRFEKILKKNGLRLTSTRKSLYKTLAGYNRPIGVNTLVNALSSQVDRSSVYRNIETFSSIGVVNKVYTGWKYRLELSEKFRPHHHHITCEKCGVIIPLQLGNTTELALIRAGMKRGFKVKNHEVELRGLCKNCS